MVLTQGDLRAAMQRIRLDTPSYVKTYGDGISFRRTEDDTEIVSAVITKYHDGRVKAALSAPGGNSVWFVSKEFDRDGCWASLLRVIVGPVDHRFRSRRRAMDFTSFHHPSVSFIMDHFSQFMEEVRIAIERKSGKDVKDSVERVRTELTFLVNHLSEDDMVRLYREASVDSVHCL